MKLTVNGKACEVDVPGSDDPRCYALVRRPFQTPAPPGPNGCLHRNSHGDRILGTSGGMGCRTGGGGAS